MAGGDGGLAVDRVSLRNMVFYTYNGVFAAEKELGQHLAIDLDLYLDLSSAGAADELETTVNYVEVYTLVRDILEERQFNLIETIAEVIADELLAAHDLQAVTVRVRKLHPPLGGPVDYAEVEVTRRPRLAGE